MVDTVCSSLQHLLRDVLHTKIGICARAIELFEVTTGKPALEKKTNVAINDRFKLKIPLTDVSQTWEVIFNCAFPNCPPDFVMSDDVDFYLSGTLESFEEALPTLNNWDHTKNKALYNVITELRSAYLKYQVDKLDNRCAYEYAALIESKVPADHVEVLVDGNTVNFLVKLDVDLTIILPTAELDEYVALAVRFGAHGAVRSANLITSSIVVQLLGINLELPRNIKGDESLSEYVDEVARSAENQMLTVKLKRKERRKFFVFELLKHLGQSVVSYDALEYHCATFLLESDGFVCILDISLPPLFPRQAPRYRLISTYATNKDRAMSQSLILPFSDNWDITTMVDQALSLIRSKKILEFQKATLNMFKLPK